MDLPTDIKRARHTASRTFLLGTILVCVAPHRAQGIEPSFPQYVAVDLGTLGGDSFAVSINDHGEVAGYYYTLQGVQRAFLWLRRPAYGLDRGMHDIGALPGGWSFANDVNNSGQIVGASRTGAVDQFARPIEHAYRWDPITQEMTDLGTLPFYDVGSEATAINGDGWVAGNSYGDFPFFSTAFVFLPGPFDGLPAGLNQLGFTFAEDMNESGATIGWYQNDIFGSERATLWLPEPAYGLSAGSWAVPGLEDIPSRARGINNFGEIVGDYAAGGGFDPNRGFRWLDDQLDPLPTPTSFSSAGSINNQGQIVGSAGGPYTWMGSDGISFRALLPPSPLVTLHAAKRINGCGQVVGYGTVSGQLRAVLLSPVDHDVNNDGLVNAIDHGIVANCMLGPAAVVPLSCDSSDIDRDGDVDLLDYRALFGGFE